MNWHTLGSHLGFLRLLALPPWHLFPQLLVSRLLGSAQSSFGQSAMVS